MYIYNLNTYACTYKYYYIAPADHGFDKAIAAFDKSLSALGRSYLDLYLIHWPGAQGKKREDPVNAALRKESWRALERLYNNGS